MTRPPRRTPPRPLRWTVATVGAFLACLLFGITTATADLSLGPHTARYEISLGGEVTVDLGPLGTLQIDSPAGPLGVDVTVSEIPADLTEIDRATTLDGLQRDLQSYLQFFGDPATTVASVVRALVVDAVRRTLVAMAVVVVAGLGLRALLGRARRRELSAWLAPRTAEVTVGVVVVALVAGGLSADDVEPGERGVPTSPVFRGTALEGARITGRLAGVIDTYGAELVGLYRQNEKFYDDARTSLVAAWQERQADETQQALRDALAAGSGALEALGAPPAGAGAGPSPVPPSPSPSAPAPDEEPVRLLVISDLHCNTSMAPLVREVATRAGIDVLLNAGDTTMNGTAVEKVCVDAFASARPSGVPMVVSDGNHDSQVVSQAERASGQTVLDGAVVEVAGVRILGDRDPNETRVGGGTSSVESAVDEGRRLRDVACDAGDVDLLLIHTPSVGDAAMHSGCVPFQVSGHTHTRYDPTAFGLGVRYVNGSTAGAAPNQPTVGPLHGTAEMTLLEFDPAQDRFTRWKLVEVRPDATASVGAWQDVPPPVAPPASGIVPVPDAVGAAPSGAAPSGTASP
ncbi:metallophosphoesterase family protein [Puerhibacterium puerhi]|uniref:metallophosphoesterase family protein n=1 Tax=Puerhibacterium puerhi TaxID=2692623 RepID=UPI0013588C5A|nr:metallophosphoesterase [Puerhibacterium puerhi]